jgi:formylglycine-generating enzyme required for sulfatase activity
MANGINKSGLSEAEQEAVERIEYFLNDYWDNEDEVLNFACHASFPLTLTTELIYALRQHFFRDLPWSVAPELLLSSLCDAVGYDLYEMKLAVRRNLLEKLAAKSTEDGGSCLDELVEFMGDYIAAQLDASTSSIAGSLGYSPEITKWTALSFLNPDLPVTRKIENILAQLLQNSADDPRICFQVANLVKNQADLLGVKGFHAVAIERLRDLAQRVRRQEPLGDRSDALGGMRSLMRQAGFPALKTAEIQYAKIECLNSFAFTTVRLDIKGKQTIQTSQEAYFYTETLPERLNLAMVAIPSGEFMMGSPASEDLRFKDESPQHHVAIAPFFMGKYAVTHAQWRIVAGLPVVTRELNLRSRAAGDNHPVKDVSWTEAEEFCQRLSTATGRNYQLPNEAQWEYACRAGTTTPFHFGGTITGQVANYNSSEVYGRERPVKWQKETVPVGSFPPNDFGLYDMHGNVWEWCFDHGHGNYQNVPMNDIPWTDENAEKTRVVRGGSWGSDPWFCRSACRYKFDRDFNVGFRVVCCAPRTWISALQFLP